MKRSASAITLMLTLVFSAVAVSRLNLFVKANFCFGPSNPLITMISPTNTTYNTNDLSLQVTFATYKTGYPGGPDSDATRLFTYTLDGKAPENITITNASVASYPGGDVFFEGLMRLPKLTEGAHNLTVNVVFDYPPGGGGSSYQGFHTASSSKVYFRIDTVPQYVSVLMPENNTYMLIVPLEFSINESASWIGYSIDGQANATVTGNTNLLGLSVGQHTLKLYAKDAYGNPATSKTITFSIADPLPSLLVVVAVSSAAIGVLVYFKKRKH